MPSSTVTVRLPDEVIEQLQARAGNENKKVSDIVREFILEGLAPEPDLVLPDMDAVQDAGPAYREILERLEQIEAKIVATPKESAPVEGQPILRTALGLEAVEKRLAALIAKAIKISATGQYYARMGALEAIDLSSIWSEQINAPENAEARKRVQSKLDAEAIQYARWWVENG